MVNMGLYFTAVSVYLFLFAVLSLIMQVYDNSVSIILSGIIIFYGGTFITYFIYVNDTDLLKLNGSTIQNIRRGEIGFSDIEENINTFYADMNNLLKKISSFSALVYFKLSIYMSTIMLALLSFITVFFIQNTQTISKTPRVILEQTFFMQTEISTRFYISLSVFLITFVLLFTIPFRFTVIEIINGNTAYESLFKSWKLTRKNGSTILPRVILGFIILFVLIIIYNFTSFISLSSVNTQMAMFIAISFILPLIQRHRYQIYTSISDN